MVSDRTLSAINGAERSGLPARFSLLTASRYFAALSVLLYHLPPVSQWLTEHQHPWGLRLLENGYVAVTYFFVLSGFVLSHGYLAGFSTLTLPKMAAFYRARLVRILPVWLLLSLPYLVHVPDAKWVAYVTFTQAWSGNPDVAFAYLAVTWTLSVEFFFYLLFPMLARLTHGLTGWTGAILFLAIGLAIPLGGAIYFSLTGLDQLPDADPSSAHRWLYRSPIARLGDFLIGIGIYLTFYSAMMSHSRAMRVLRRRTSLSGVVLGACIMSMIGLGLLPQSLWTYDIQFLPVFAPLIGCLAWCETQGRWRAGASLVLLGEASYALYVVHYIYGRELLDPLQQHAGTDKMTFSLWAILFLTIVSVGCYTSVERPLQRLLRPGGSSTIRSAH